MFSFYLFLVYFIYVFFSFLRSESKRHKEKEKREREKVTEKWGGRGKIRNLFFNVFHFICTWLIYVLFMLFMFVFFLKVKVKNINKEKEEKREYEANISSVWVYFNTYLFLFYLFNYFLIVWSGISLTMLTALPLKILKKNKWK